MKQNVTILVVDDEQVINDAVKKICSEMGWFVESANDSINGFKKLMQNKYTILLCDIKMPVMNGFQILEKIKEEKLDIPVIMTTGYSTVETAIQSFQSGAIDFLSKPFTQDELLSSISRVLRYLEIKKSETLQIGDENSTIIVPCPPKYYQLSYISWINAEDEGQVTIGLTDLFIKTIDDISAINLFNDNEEIFQGRTLGTIETVDGLSHSIISPLSGKIFQTNELIKTKKDLISKDPYFEGWLYKVIPFDLENEIKKLVPCSSYQI